MTDDLFFSAEPSIISSNLDVLTASGLGELVKQDFAFVKETCHALLKLAVLKPKTDAPTAPNRYIYNLDFFLTAKKIAYYCFMNVC